MVKMSLSDIAKACQGVLYGKDTDKISSVTIDSRLVEEGSLFIATKGERVDGHSFIPVAIEKGAVAVVSEKPCTISVPYILVEDSFVALKAIAEYYRMRLSIPVVGITGSVGKTSTKEFIAAVLSEKFCTLKTQGNYNNEVGLPLTVLKIRKEHEAAVLEMGISEFNEMHRLSKVAKPDIAVITNIGMCHLENLIDRDGVLKAKTEIFDYLKEDGIVCLNGDDDKLITITGVKGRKPVFFGMGNNNDITVRDIVSHGLTGSECVIITPQGEVKVNVPLPGEHMVLNALAATAVGLSLGLSLSEIAEGISKVKPVSGRSNLIMTDKYNIIDDCYNANPVSMKAAIDLLKMAETRTVAVLGDMFELGSDEVSLHTSVGMYVAEKNVDVLICVGNLSKNMYEGALDFKKNNPECKTHVYYYENQEMLLKELNQILMENDTVLFKASHGMRFDEIIKKQGLQ